MSDNDKMREEFEKWARTEYFDLDSIDGFYSDDDTHIAWGAWQAAQSVPVDEDRVISIAGAYESGIGHCNDTLCNPYKAGSAESFAYDYGKEFGKARGIEQSVSVVGNVIGYLAGGTMMRRQIQGYECKPLVVQPTNSITTAELERLRKDAERYQMVVKISTAALCHPSTRTDQCNSALSAYQSAVNSGIGIVGAIDAAIAAEGEKE